VSTGKVHRFALAALLVAAVAAGCRSLSSAPAGAGESRTGPGGKGDSARNAEQWLKAAREALASKRPLKIEKLRASATRVKRYEKLELTFELGGTYANPFDPREVDVVAEFKGPSGRALKLPGFYYQDLARGEGGTVRAAGAACWKVRFAPVEVGDYTYRLKAKDRTGAEARASGRFACVAGKGRGFVRVHPKNPHYLAFASGETYFPVGINVFFTTRVGKPLPDARLPTCLRQMRNLAENGGNFVRLRADGWWLALEMCPDRACGYLGLGYYHPRTCWEIDRIVDLAGERGLYIMFCADNANANVNDPTHKWQKAYNLYVKGRGGPCEKPRDYWTNPEARRLARQRLRYITARWAYSPQVMAWEFWNEVNLRRCPTREVAAWHAEMAKGWRALDPYGRPVTTSLMGDAAAAADVWKIPELGIVQEHLYNTPDVADAHAEAVRGALGHRRKPFFIGEYGARSRNPQLEKDPEGVQLHNGLWAPAFAGSCGTAALWYVENHLERFKLHRHYRAFTEFAGSIRWPRYGRRFRVGTPQLAKGGERPKTRRSIDVALPRSNRWTFKKPPVTEFVVLDDGSVSKGEMIRTWLHCSEARKAPPTFVVDLSEPARFEVRVTQSVGDATNALVIDVDGKEVKRAAFPAGKGRGKGLKSEYIEEYDNWRTDYDTRVIVEVPKGRHRIRPHAIGKDRLEVEYRLLGLVTTNPGSRLRAMSFDDGACLYVWVQDTRSTVDSVFRDASVLPVEHMAMRVRGLPPGEYLAEWWDTWEGKWVSKAELECAGDSLELAIPRFKRDLACRLRRADGKALVRAVGGAR
jgi:hypothetical protein